MGPCFSASGDALQNFGAGRNSPSKKPPAITASGLVFPPSLRTALALEHAHGSAFAGVEHAPDQRGLLAATGAYRDWIGLESVNHFVLKFVVHGNANPKNESVVPKLLSAHKFQSVRILSRKVCGQHLR
jgi:hypothetical protein